MAQVLEFKLPDLGEGLTEAEIVRWLVEVGDVVAVDQPVVEVETAKAMVEVPCPYGGVVTARFGAEGTELPVGAPLLTVAVGESAEGRPGGGASAEGARGQGSAAEGSGNVLVGYGTSQAPARRRRIRPAEPASAASAAPTAPTANGRLRPTAETRETAETRGTPGTPETRGAPDTPQTPGGTGAAESTGVPSRTPGAADGPVPVISPLVRRLARQNGLDLREMTGSGPDGLILRADVEYALRAAAAQGRTAGEPRTHVARAGAPTAAGVTTGTPAVTRVPLKGIRGAVADKLSRSRTEIPDATCWVDADATELMRTRAAMNAAGGPKISVLALLARICTAALARFPELNSSVDTGAREVVQYGDVHLGFAAQTDRGLVVPVVRDAHARDAESLTAEFARLTEAARAGALAPAELTGGTFTLNNYGVFGVDGSTPIINHPEAAMLGVGRIVPKPWVHEGELAVRQVVQLSLTFDHRVCDGGTAGGFLRYVADCVEQPAVLLRTL
ncbi:dihydrolipoamide acetyltransferase family protein [Streptomyces griseoloalbus]|uniref:Dihydrolipoamide acetyltransferase component of pyruvate dehydrogenase complex n=1 Tax=Streptomyces griseoloalbus TaxID=67303 RepID=A0A7W8F8Z6_9ACTN|nr:dihydrolipoamide acetyltransferase family protein [Streptomyces albaduncus]MBB5127638.1 pyruvate dehydrogenase E2 component (dihydrolipoamide acetyltransferase) [Streptomyces albaduncus]GGW62283.1 dihydrolipoamide acetyltransferase component of pyruvate dehydrogenase complex [Streptomyces albaduncus]